MIRTLALAVSMLSSACPHNADLHYRDTSDGCDGYNLGRNLEHQLECVAREAHLRPGNAVRLLIATNAAMTDGEVYDKLSNAAIGTYDWLKIADQIIDEDDLSTGSNGRKPSDPAQGNPGLGTINTLHYNDGESRPVDEKTKLQSKIVALKLAANKLDDDVSLQAEIWSRILRIELSAKDLSWPVYGTREILVTIAQRDPLVRFSVIQQRALDKDADTVKALCRSPLDARLAWPCVEGDPDGIRHYLPAIAGLPVLTLANGEQLAKLDGLRALPGLSCITDPRTEVSEILLAWTDKNPRSTPIPGEIEIYYRLHEDATPPVAQCLLGRAAMACIATALGGRACSMPYVVGDYIATLNESARDLYIRELFGSGVRMRKFIELSHDNGKRILLNVYIGLANLLVAKPRGEPFWLTPYHVVEADKLWPAMGDQEIPFAAMFSPEVIEQTCHQLVRFCDSACSSSSSCRNTCLELGQHAAQALCH